MDFGKVMAITGLNFTLLTLIFNFIRAPFHIPGDLYIDQLGFKFYVPIISTIVISILVTLILSSLPK